MGKIPVADRIRSHANRELTLMHRGQTAQAYPLFNRLVNSEKLIRNWDGSRYPVGGDIGGMAGRILAVADCYEAMTTQ